MTLPIRTFGVEIEATGISRRAAVTALREAGITASMENYNHRTQVYWKVTTDASVEPGFEIVSPILSGEEGITQMRTVARALGRAGARVNRECGLHVHVGIGDLNANEVAKIVSRYARFESTLDSWMPPSRRGDENRFCLSVVRFGRSIEATGNFRRVSDVVAHQYGRYVKVNLECYRRQQTIEFRQHSGTCNASKIENWIRFLLHFVEASRGMAPEVTTPQRPMTRARRTTAGVRRNSMAVKLDRVIQAFGSADRSTLTVSEIARIGGWSESSVPVYMSRLRNERGARIRKITGTDRYRMTRAGRLAESGLVVPNDAPVEVEAPAVRRAARVVGLAPTPGDSIFSGIPGDIEGYYAERGSELLEASGR